MASLAAVRKDAGAYPAELLKDCSTGLLLFGAAFQGRNDGIHFHDAGLRCDVVDTDGLRLDLMAALYPDDWRFIAADAWWFAGTARQRYDAVSVDCWTGDLGREVLFSLGLWCSLARKLVTVTVENDVHAFPAVPGWRSSILRRSALASWLVLERS